MITALFWILIGLVVLDVIAHFQHITLLSELKNELAIVRNKIDGGKLP